MKEVAFKKYRKNLVLTVIYLKIPFHLYQPTFGRDEFFFPFSSKIPYAYFLNGLTPKKKLHQMCYCEVRTLQTKSTMYKQCKQNSRDFVKKFWLLSWTPQRLRQIDAPGWDKSLSSGSYNGIIFPRRAKSILVASLFPFPENN